MTTRPSIEQGIPQPGAPKSEMAEMRLRPMKIRSLATLIAALIVAAIATGGARTMGTARGNEHDAGDDGPRSAMVQATQTSGAPTPASSSQPKEQARGQSSAAPTTLRATTRLVEISVVVQDKHGDPVTGLKKSDFVVLDDRKPQEVQTFEVETNQVPKHPPAPLPPDTYTNRLQERAGVPTSITVILLDGLNTQFKDQSIARKQVVKFLQQIQPQDRVALFVLGRDLRVLHDFTSDSASLLQALNQSPSMNSPGLAPPPPDQSALPVPALVAAIFDDIDLREAQSLQQDRVRLTVEALTEIANHIGTLPGRKNLIWVSASFPDMLGYDSMDDPALTNPQSYFGAEIEAAVRALTDANIAVYPVDARGLIGGGVDVTNDTSDPGTETLQTMLTLADRTGGKAYYNTEDLFGSIRQAIDDSRVTYELGYYPENVTWNGRFRSIKVEVDVPGARVRARKGYFALSEPKLTAQTRQALIAETAESPLEATAIGVKVQVLSAGPQGQGMVKLGISFDPHDFLFDHSDGVWRANVDSVVLQIDDQNKIVDGLDQTIQLHFDEATYQRLMNEGVYYTREIAIKPASRTVRVILRDASNGNIGDTTIPLAKYLPQK